MLFRSIIPRLFDLDGSEVVFLKLKIVVQFHHPFGEHILSGKKIRKFVHVDDEPSFSRSHL